MAHILLDTAVYPLYWVRSKNTLKQGQFLEISNVAATCKLMVKENLERSWKKSWKVMEFEELKRVWTLFLYQLYHEFLSVLFQFFISLGTSQSCKTFMFIWKASFYSCILWFNVCYTLHGHDCKCIYISKNTVAGCLLTINCMWCCQSNLIVIDHIS